jgi:hypothetical protein
MGGDELTIVGQGFEFVHMADNSVKIYSADMADMACDVTSVTSTELKCTTNAFGFNSGVTADHSLTVTVNGKISAV